MKYFYKFFRITFSMMVFIGFVCQNSQAQKISYSDNLYKAGFNLQAQNRSGVTVNYSVKEFSLAPVQVEGKGMNTVELPGFWLPNDEGAPNLPGGGRYIAIPEGAKAILNIVSMRTERYQNVEIAPAPRIPKDDEPDPPVLKENPAIYTRNAYYPAEPVKLSAPSKIRGVDVVMLGITPFQYNPVTKELVVYRDIQVEVQFQGGNGQFGEERLRSRFWDPILEDALLNPASLPKVDYSKRALNSRASNGCEYLIIVPDGPEFMQYAEEIRTFRIQQGITTDIVTTSEIGGNNTSTIENYINNLYATWDPVPSAIMIMADYGSNTSTNITAPIWNNYCVSDNIYGDIDGDNLPDIVMARMTANNAAQLEVMVSKFMEYESNPPTNPDFYNYPITALGWQTDRWFQICSEVVGGYFRSVKGKDPVRINEVNSGNPSIDPWSTAQNTSTVIGVFGPNGLNYIPATPQELGGWSGGTATQINAAINNGSFMLQHRDHGMETGWGEPSYTNTNINGLTNTDLTFVFSVNCLTGKYNWTSECFAEKFHRYTYNGQNSGALGLIAASETSYSFVNDTYVWGMYDNMWPDFMPQYGSNPAERGELPAFGNAAGKYFLAQSSWPYNTSEKVVTYNLFHHHGDAFLCLYSEVPQNLTVIDDGIILAGLDEFTITADENSVICLSVGDNIIGLATGTGSPQVINIVPQAVGTMVHLTITKQNYFRHEEDFQVIPADGPYCIYDTYTVNDEGGNGNGLIDYNETILLNLQIKNVGLSDGENVNVTISTGDPFVMMMDDNENFGMIPSGQNVSIPDGFSFYIPENIPDQHPVYFNVIATDGTNTWNSLFVVKVNAPVLQINSLSIDDQESGNGNGRLDPGESAGMTVNYSNTGHATAYNVNVFMEGQSGYVEVLNPSQSFSSIGFMGLFNKTYDVTVDENTPEGILVNFVNEVTMGNYYGDRIFPEKISAMFEDFETGDFDKYSWDFSGSQSWQIINDFPYQGFYSAKSGTITASQNSELKITYQVMTNDSITFFKKVSSEPNDKLQFYIGTTMMQEWSGTSTGWTRVSFPVTAGTRTFRWVYTKNGSGSSGADCAWIDNITFPTPMALTLWAGPDKSICSGETFNISDSYGTYYDQLAWTTSGTGTFDNNTIMHPVYTPSDEDLANGGVTLSLDLSNSGGDNASDEMSLTFSSGPEAPLSPSGPDYIDLLTVTSSEYIAEPLSGITEYSWILTPAEAGTIEGNNLNANVTWNPDYLGTAYISIAGIDDCGTGAYSPEFEVTVDNSVSVSEISGENIGIIIFPNPSTGIFNLTLQNKNQNKLNLKVINLLGETIIERNFRVNGTYKYQLDLGAMPKGIYFLVVDNGQNSINKKIIKK